MPLMYDPASIPHGFDTGPESLTEQEHKDSCDINKIIGRMARGLNVNTKKLAPWGENFVDDTTMDAVKHRIQKEKIENDLKALASEPIEEKTGNSSQPRSKKNSVSKESEPRACG